MCQTPTELERKKYTSYNINMQYNGEYNRKTGYIHLHLCQSEIFAVEDAEI